MLCEYGILMPISFQVKLRIRRATVLEVTQQGECRKMKRFVIRPLVTALALSGLFGLSSQAMPSSFQLFEQDGASIGNYHAGYAAIASDASTAWYNPAGITRFKNQQIVVGAVGIMSDFKYQGSVAVTESVPQITSKGLIVAPATVTFPGVTAQGGIYTTVPDLHYVTPLTDWLGFGFSVDIPFGLKTNYGRGTPLRFATTLTSITVVDISPSFAAKVFDKSFGKASLGAGFDIQSASAEFDNVGVILTPAPSVLTGLPTTSIVPGFTATSRNKANGTGYGFHLGALYEISDNTRVGLSYHSQVVHHLTGSSKLAGTAATFINGGPFSTARAKANITLPPYTALSAYHRVMPQFGLMGSILYTQWNTFKTLTITNVAGAVNTLTSPFVASSSNITVSIPQNYRNTWNFTVGGDYYPSDKFILRSGIGYDQTPTLNAYCNAQIPDNDRYVIALGAHYQANKAVGIDLGWTHFFFPQARIAPPPQVSGSQSVAISGHATGGADVLGGQIVWDIA